VPGMHLNALSYAASLNVKALIRVVSTFEFDL
jgi:hypothetical protein